MRQLFQCGICGRQIDLDELHRRDTGDFHLECFIALKDVGLAITMSPDDAECSLCSGVVTKGTVIVEMFATRFAHLRCFFGQPNPNGQSVGAARARLTVAGRARLLRDVSTVLQARSHRLRARSATLLGLS